MSGADERTDVDHQGGVQNEPVPGGFAEAFLPSPRRDVQLKGTPSGQDEQVHAAAAAGVDGAGTSLPFLDTIQASFGEHDLSGVHAHIGGQAADACADIGATAYASGQDVAFAGPPDLHTAAHEAAHVVQQRSGVHLKGGVGESGDAYEREADDVADAVVRGERAELPASRGNLPRSDRGVQRKEGPTAAGGADELPVGFEIGLTGILEMDVVAGDIERARTRVKLVQAQCRSLHRPQRQTLLHRLEGPSRGDALAALFQYKLATAERERVLAVLRDETPAATEDPATPQDEPAALLQSDDPAVHGRPVAEVGAEIKAKAANYARFPAQLQTSAQTFQRDERRVLDDHDGVVGWSINLFNDHAPPDPARWNQIVVDWGTVLQLLTPVLAGLPTPQNINGLGQLTENGLRLWETTMAKQSRYSNQFIQYLEGFAQAAQSVHAGVELTSDILMAAAVGCAVVLTGPAALAVGAQLAGAVGATGVAAKVIIGTTAVIAAGATGAATEGTIQATGQVTAETVEMVSEVVNHGKTWNQAAAGFDWGAVKDQGWEGVQRGFVDGVLALGGAGLERLAAKGAGALFTRLFGKAGQGMLANVVRVGTERALASGLAGSVVGALDAGLKAALDGKSYQEVIAAMKTGATVGGVLGAGLGGTSGALQGRKAVLTARQVAEEIDDLGRLLAADPDAFAAKYNELLEQMPPEQLADFQRELAGRRFVDAEHYKPAKQLHDAGHSSVRPEHRYGEQEFLDWEKASQYLAEKAKTGQALTSADVQEAHRLAAQNVSPEAGNYRTTGTGNQPLIGGGGVGYRQAWSSLSPDQIAVMQSNPHLRLLERNAMDSLLTPEQITAQFETAIIAYPDAGTVGSRVDDFFVWCATHRGTMDPVDFAAAAQRHLVSIHPFVDGNGRLSRLIMDHALQSRGLPTALLSDVNIDYMVSEAAWAGEVRRGVMETYRTAASYAGVFNQGVRETNLHKVAAAWAALLSLEESPEQVAVLLYGPQESERAGGE